VIRPIFLPGARADLLEGIRYYHGQSPRVAQDFVAEVRRAVRFVAENPEASPRLRGDVRKKVLLKFPYSILYAAEARHALIVAVASHSRRPDYWHGRID
jgi:plasmid stabilization system protein ParE